MLENRNTEKQTCVAQGMRKTGKGQNPSLRKKEFPRSRMLSKVCNKCFIFLRLCPISPSFFALTSPFFELNGCPQLQVGRDNTCIGDNLWFDEAELPNCVFLVAASCSTHFLRSARAMVTEKFKSDVLDIGPQAADSTAGWTL